MQYLNRRVSVFTLLRTRINNYVFMKKKPYIKNEPFSIFYETLHSGYFRTQSQRVVFVKLRTIRNNENKWDTIVIVLCNAIHLIHR